VKLNDTHGSQLLLKWNLSSLITGASCAQAFSVEYSQHGGGWRGWSRWSAVAACALLVRQYPPRPDLYSCTKDLVRIDCGKRMLFRVVAHNLFNPKRLEAKSSSSEATIECKKGKFMVRTPHVLSYEEERRRRLRLQGPEWAGGKKRRRRPTRRPRLRTSTTSPRLTTTGANASEVNDTSTTTRTTTSTTTTTTIAFAGEPYPTTTEAPAMTSSSSTKGSLSKTLSLIALITQETLILLPGKYSSAHSGDSYEVRHNLKDFQRRRQDLSFCYRYLAYDLADSCRNQGQIHPGNDCH